MTPELEVLDQLLGGDLPASVILSCFPDLEHCSRAIQAMLKSGEVTLLDQDGNPTQHWQWRELLSSRETWTEESPFRIGITDAGARRGS